MPGYLQYGAMNHVGLFFKSYTNLSTAAQQNTVEGDTHCNVLGKNYILGV